LHRTGDHLTDGYLEVAKRFPERFRLTFALGGKTALSRRVIVLERLLILVSGLGNCVPTRNHDATTSSFRNSENALRLLGHGTCSPTRDKQQNL
jgi:hypothetical protein